MREIHSFKDLPDENLLTGGHSLCAGCGAVLGLKLALLALGKRTIVINASGCMTLQPTYPYTPFLVPWCHLAMENAAAAATGIWSALKALKKEKDINIVCYVGDGACYSGDTEIFTEDGFKNIKKLKIWEKIWSVNPETNELELVEMEKFHQYYYQGKMIRLKTRFMDFLITPNHNVPIWFNKKWKFIAAKELEKRYKTTMLRSFNWNGNSLDGGQYLIQLNMKKTGTYQKIYRPSQFDLKKWLRFLGWYLSEGCLYKSKSGYLIRIYQSDKFKRKEILELLTELGFKPFECSRSIDFQSKQIYEYLEKECGKGSKNKKIPKWVLSLNKEYLMEIFYALIMGDGNIHKQRNRNVPHVTFVTSSEKLMNNFVELVLKLGKNCNISLRSPSTKFHKKHNKVYKPCYYIGVNLKHLKHILYSRRKLYEKRGTKQIFEEDYDGFVYCPQLRKNHTVIIKRNGKICLSGNSYDIGLQSLSGAIQNKTNFIFICYNNSAFANTGVQMSSATPKFAYTTTTPLGNPFERKPLTKILAAHRTSYVATACVSEPIDFINKLKKAAKIKGPKFIDLLTPCPTGWGFDSSNTIEIGREAVRSGAWPLYEIESGKFTLNSKKTKPVREYLLSQGRFKHLKEREIKEIQSWINEEWKLLQKGKFWEAKEY